MNVENPSDELRIEPLDLSPAGIRKVRQLLNVVWPAQTYLTEEYLDWEYNQNPTGAAFGFNAWLGDELIGHYASQPIRAKVLDNPNRLGLLLINTAIHPKHRRPRLFFRLATKAFAEGPKAGFGYYTGISNQQASSLYTKYLGGTQLGQLDANIGFGEPRYISDDFDYDFKRLWNEDELRWRLNRPGNPYRLRHSKNNPTLLTPTAYPVIKAEFELPREYRSMPFDHWLKPAGFSPLRIWIGKDPNIDWRHVPRFNLPVRYRPSPLNILYKDIENPEQALNPERVRFHLLDFDAY